MNILNLVFLLKFHTHRFNETWNMIWSGVPERPHLITLLKNRLTAKY